MHKLGLSTRPSGAYRPSAYGMSAPLPANAAPGSKADKLRPDMYKLSATVQTRTSDDEPTQNGSYQKSPNWFGGASAPPNSKKSTRVDNSDNDSQRSLRIKSARSSEEDNFQSGILVSKSFYITDEERGSVLSAPYRWWNSAIYPQSQSDAIPHMFACPCNCERTWPLPAPWLWICEKKQELGYKIHGSSRARKRTRKTCLGNCKRSGINPPHSGLSRK